jgi:DNA polymerase III subunit epsilon
MYAIVDIETTGGFSQSHKIIEIAIVIHDGTNVVNEYSSLVNPERNIPPFITGLTGISNGMVEDAPKFYEVAKEIYQLLENKIFVAHNVGFDYSFIHQEFSSLGAQISLKKLCTVKLSRKIIPGMASYSLGNLCGQLGIAIDNRHRALGDAAATSKLFHLLLSKDDKKVIEKALKKNAKEAKLPQHINSEVVQELPELTGVYYFLDGKGKIIYIGKAKNIRKRVLSHFSANTKDFVKQNFINEIYEIKYDLCGNELIALLHESQLIKRFWPIYNRAQKHSGFNHGIFHYEDRLGYKRLSIGKVNSSDQPLITFPNLAEARKFLSDKISEFKLCPKLSGMQQTPGGCFDYQLKICKGACCGKESAEDYNHRLGEALSTFKHENRSFTILGRGRAAGENSIVLVENGKYLGYGYISKEVKARELNLLKPYIDLCEDNPDIRKIIKAFIQKYPEQKSVYFI